MICNWEAHAYNFPNPKQGRQEGFENNRLIHLDSGCTMCSATVVVLTHQIQMGARRQDQGQEIKVGDHLKRWALFYHLVNDYYTVGWDYRSNEW